MLKRILKWLWEFVEVLIIIYVIFITSCILCRNKFGYTQFSDMTFITVNDSNTKFIQGSKPGDLLIVRGQQTGLDKGDLIYYYITVDEKYVVRTGVIGSKTEDDYSALYVLNDEEKTSVASNRVIGKYVSTHPEKGSVLEVLESRFGFLFLVLLPILIVFIYQVYQLVIVARYEVVEDDEEEKPKKKELPKKEEKTIVKEEKIEEKVEDVKSSATDKFDEVMESHKDKKIVEEKQQKDDDVELL